MDIPERQFGGQNICQIAEPMNEKQMETQYKNFLTL